MFLSFFLLRLSYNIVMISYGNEKVLMYRVRNDKVPRFERLVKLMPTQKKFVIEHANRAINEYKKFIILAKANEK